MKIISINCGSSSLKFSLFEMDNEEVLPSGNFERIGMEGSCYTLKFDGQKITENVEMNDHTRAVELLLEKLIALDIIKSYSEINGIGHRIVHGGTKYSKSVFITDKVIDDISSLRSFAPLHNPAHVLGIQAFRKVLPDVPMVAVFDTAFHQSMSEVAYLYPVPYHWYKDYGIRKYGAHGTSHRYVAESVRDLLDRNDLKIISCHLGNGGSISAIKNMKCIDTSMGFTPLAGIMMGTRSGDVDPSIIPYVMEKEGKNVGEVLDDLNTKSGLLGVSGISNDMRDIIDKCDIGEERAILAKDKFIQRVVDYIAQYYVRLEGCDILVFTAGIGENNIPIRREICEKLACLGVKIDLDQNNIRGEVVKISSPDSKILVYVIPTDEELMIARDTLKLILDRK